MKGFVFLLLFHSTSAVIHSLKYFYTASSGVPNVPEFMALGKIDGVEIMWYDTNTSRAEPKQDWMGRVTAEDPQHWETETEGLLDAKQTMTTSIQTIKEHFNQSGGAHTLQKMYGCEWDDETQDVYVFMQYGYDGEDFLAFDARTQTWVAAQPQALLTKDKWDKDAAWTTDVHRYLLQICPVWLKKYLDYGRSYLLRTELPSVSLLQKSPSSPITCFATDFFPDRSMIFWRKDGEDIEEGVAYGDIRPNHDGRFQSSTSLDPPPDQDWDRYECVFQLAGVRVDIVTRLNKAAIKSNPENSMKIPIFIILAGLALLSLATEAIFVFLRRQNRGKLFGHLDFGCSSSEKPPDYDKVVNARPQN